MGRLLTISSFGLLGCLFGCHTYSTHVYGRITDDHKRPLSHIKIAIVKVHLGKTPKVDSLATAYSDEKGDYATTFQTRKLYKRVQLIRPQQLDAALANQNRGITIMKGNQPISNCCSIEIGKANNYSFILQAKR